MPSVLKSEKSPSSFLKPINRMKKTDRVQAPVNVHIIVPSSAASEEDGHST